MKAYLALRPDQVRTITACLEAAPVDNDEAKNLLEALQAITYVGDHTAQCSAIVNQTWKHTL